MTPLYSANMADSPTTPGRHPGRKLAGSRAYLNDAVSGRTIRVRTPTDLPAMTRCSLRWPTGVGLRRTLRPRRRRRSAGARPRPRRPDCGGWPRPAAGQLDPDTVVGPHSFDTAVHACGGAMAAVDAVLDGEATAAFSAGRPPASCALFSSWPAASASLRLASHSKKSLTVSSRFMRKPTATYSYRCSLKVFSFSKRR